MRIIRYPESEIVAEMGIVFDSKAENETRKPETSPIAIPI